VGSTWVMDETGGMMTVVSVADCGGVCMVVAPLEGIMGERLLSLGGNLGLVGEAAGRWLSVTTESVCEEGWCDCFESVSTTGMAATRRLLLLSLTANEVERRGKRSNVAVISWFSVRHGGQAENRSGCGMSRHDSQRDQGRLTCRSTIAAAVAETARAGTDARTLAVED
jgi:hypothetical protein